MNNLQNSSMLDGKLPVACTRGSWRWAFQCPGPGGRHLFRFKILKDGTRLMRLSAPGHDIADLMDLVEDMALHDWLLSTVEGIVERAELGSGPTEKMLIRVRPVIDHVLHHWMPGAQSNRICCHCGIALTGFRDSRDSGIYWSIGCATSWQ